MRTKLRRLARVETLIEPYLQRQKEEEQKAREFLVRIARDHAIKLGALVLRGEPKLNEPLEIAWKRCLTRFSFEGNISHLVLQNLPGESEQKKFQHVLDITPPWLLRFTQALLTAGILGLKCPDYSRAPPEGIRARSRILTWPLLPLGTLQEGGPVRPFKEEELTDEERTQLVELVEECAREIELEELQSGSPGALKRIPHWRRNQRRRGQR
jgi:hypothetical protein